MLKALIVDDEPAHRHGLSRHVSWSSLGYEKPDEAEDAEEALFLSSRNSYDVFIVDVCMPGMDGIELVRQLQRIHKNINVLIISGYEEFEFARGAVEAGARAYLLKPLKIEEVEQWLKTFADNINRQRQVKEADRLMQQKLDSSLELAREKYMEELLSDIEYNQGADQTQLELLNLPCKNFCYKLAVLSPDRFPELVKKDPKSAAMLIPRISNMAKVLLADFFDMVFVKMLSDQLAVFLIDKDPGKTLSRDELESLLGMLQESFSEEDGITITISISKQGTKWDEAKKLYKESMYLLNKARLQKNGQLLWAEDSRQFENSCILDINQLQDRIVSSINICDYENTQRFLEIALDQLEKTCNCSITYVQAFSIGIIGALIKNAELMNIELGKDYINVYDTLLKCSGVTGLRKTLAGMVAAFIKLEQEHQSKQKNQSIIRLLEYIDSHLKDDITVNRLADHVHMNASYLSVLFKKEMGETISDYITRIRIEKAKELLRNNEIKIYEISLLVGYQTASYFTHQFKRAVGCTPAEFRERRL